MKLARRGRSRRASGFTLIELLVVIVILAILAAVVIQRVSHRTEDARSGKTISDVKTIDSALEMYKLDIGSYPTSDEGLGVLLATNGNPKWNGPYLKG